MTSQDPPTAARVLVLEGMHVRLRTMDACDADGPFGHWLADPKIVHPMNLPVRELPREKLVDYIEGFDRRTRFLFAIEDGTELVGSAQAFCGFWMVQVDSAQHTATVYLASDPGHRLGPVVALETILLASDWMLEAGIVKVSAQAVSTNRRAINLFRTIGFPQEGMLRDEVFDLTRDEGRVDLVRYGILRREYPAFRERLKQQIARVAARIKRRNGQRQEPRAA